IRSSFNIYIPIEVRSTRYYNKLIFRYPILYKLTKDKYPSIVDKKLSSKVETYT
ncbi:hypothetical protein BJ875DRAFT_386915, partial [Amylocarpus encephaloides]